MSSLPISVWQYQIHIVSSELNKEVLSFDFTFVISFFSEQDDGVTFVSSSWTFLCCSSMGSHNRHIHSNNVSYVHAHVCWRWSSLWMEKLCLFIRKGLYARQIIFICILCLSLLFQSLLNLNQQILHLTFLIISLYNSRM